MEFLTAGGTMKQRSDEQVPVLRMAQMALIPVNINKNRMQCFANPFAPIFSCKQYNNKIFVAQTDSFFQAYIYSIPKKLGQEQQET